MKTISYVIALVGVLAIVAGIVLKVGGHHHGLEALAVGAVLLIGGLVASFVIKPKAQAAA